jgi:Spy/CpxP family protein refolding chaperone
MRKTTVIGAFLSAVLLSVATVAEAQPPGPRRQRVPPHEFLERDLEKLDLEPTQKEKVDAILTAAKQSRRTGRSELRAAFDQMRTLLEAESPDEAAIMRQADKIGGLKTEEHKAMLRTLLAVRAELTPEQREKLKTMGRRKGPPPWRQQTPDADTDTDTDADTDAREEQ